MAGIVRANDRVAFWHEAADNPIWEEELANPPTSEPPSGAPKPPAGVSVPGGVTIPNSNKFKGPAGGLKKILDTIPDNDPTPPNSHPAVANFFTGPTNSAFAGTYFKPGYQDALKAHLGESNYNKLLKHAPPAHVTSLTTHQQLPAPKSNKFVQPGNQLKKLLEHPDTQTQHVTSWLEGHPGFQTYMKPEYDTALKSHLGDKAYGELKKHLETADKNPITPPPSTSIDEGKALEQAKSVDLNHVMKDLQAANPNFNSEFFAGHDEDSAKAKLLHQITKADKGGYKDVAEKYQQVYDKHFGQPTPEEVSVPEQPANPDAEDIKAIQQEMNQGGTLPEDQPKIPMGDQALKILNGEVAVKSDAVQAWNDAGSDPAKAQSILKNLMTSDAAKKDPEKMKALQALHDSYNTGQPATPTGGDNIPGPPEQAVKKTPELLADIKAVFPNAHEDLGNMSDEQVKAQLENMLKYLPEHPGYQGHKGIPGIQKVYDKWFGAGGTPAAPTEDPAASAAQPELGDALLALQQGGGFGGMSGSSVAHINQKMKSDPAWAKNMLEGVVKNQGDTPYGQGVKKLLDQYFGGASASGELSNFGLDPVPAEDEWEQQLLSPQSQTNPFTNTGPAGDPSTMDSDFSQIIPGHKWHFDTPQQVAEFKKIVGETLNEGYDTGDEYINSPEKIQQVKDFWAKHFPEEQQPEQGETEPADLGYGDEAYSQSDPQDAQLQELHKQLFPNGSASGTTPEEWIEKIKGNAAYLGKSVEDYVQSKYPNSWEKVQKQIPAAGGKVPPAASLTDFIKSQGEDIAGLTAAQMSDYKNKYNMSKGAPDVNDIIQHLVTNGSFTPTALGLTELKNNPENAEEKLKKWAEGGYDGAQSALDTFFGPKAQTGQSTAPFDHKTLLQQMADSGQLHPGTAVEIGKQTPDDFMANLEWAKNHPGQNENWQAIAKAYDAAQGGTSAPAVADWGNQSKSLLQEYADLYGSHPENVGLWSKLDSPEKAKKYLESQAEAYEGDEKQGEIQALIDKYFGGEAATPAPSGPIDHVSLLKDLAAKGLISKDTADTIAEQTPEKFQNNIDYVKNHDPDGAKWNGTGWGAILKAWDEAQAGGGSAAPSAPAAEGISGLDTYAQHFYNKPYAELSQFFKDDAKANWENLSPGQQAAYAKQEGSTPASSGGGWDPNMPTPEWMQKHYGNSDNWTPDKIKKWWSGNGESSIAGNSWKTDFFKDKDEHLQKYQGAGAPAGPPVPPPWSGPDFATEYNAIVPNSSSSVASGSATAEKAMQKVQQLINDYPNTEQTAKLQKLYDKWFVGTPGGGSATPTKPFDGNGLAQAYADIFGKSVGNTSLYTDLGSNGINDPTKVKKWFEDKIIAWQGSSSPKAQKAKELYEQYFGGGANPYSPENIQIAKPPPDEDEGVSAPFKGEEPKDEDVAAWTAAKPSGGAQWKDFVKWWGATKVTPEQEQAIYSAWFPGKNPEKATNWFNKVYSFYSKPSTDDLGASDMPSWAASSWAFGNNAEKEWPTFKQWASTDPGLPKGLSIKQKLQVWNGLSAGDKQLIEDNYAPKNPVDNQALIGALQAAYPDSDFSHWASLPQGSLKHSVENLAKAGFKGAIPLYNQYYGGNMPIPEDNGEKDAAEAGPLNVLPLDKIPEWAKGKMGSNGNVAYNYTLLSKLADAMGPEYTQQLEDNKGESYVGYGHPLNSQDGLLRIFNRIPDATKMQLAALPPGAAPFHNKEEFDKWMETAPKPVDDVKQILPDESLNDYTWSEHPVGSYASYQRSALQSLMHKYEGDGPTYQKLLGVYHKWFGTQHQTLAQALKGMDPATDWDSYLKKTPKATVIATLKKQLKTEQDPEKFVQLVDIWHKYFSEQNSGVGAIKKVVGKNQGNGDPVGAAALSMLKNWKEQGSPTDMSPKDMWWYHKPDNFDPGAYIKSLSDPSGSGKGSYPEYMGWTPPGGGNFKADPAQMGDFSTTKYTAPETKAAGGEYKTLLDQMAKHKASFSSDEIKTLGSEEFQSWFNSNPKAYKDSFKHNPGVVLDDFKAFMGGSTAELDTPDSSGQVYDVSPFANLPKPGSPGIKKFPRELTHNPPRSDNSGPPIKFPRQEDAQETIPGAQWAPQYAPMPVYRLLNFSFGQDPEERIPDAVKKMPLKQRQLIVQRQRNRLRRIDEILNGESKNTSSATTALTYLNQWGQKFGVPEDSLKELAGEMFSEQPSMFGEDDNWKYFADFAKKHSLPASAMTELAEQMKVAPPEAVKGNYEHPELADLILDYLEWEGHGNLAGGASGSHWTRDINKLYEGIPAAGLHPSGTMDANERRTPVLISGLWGGQGEHSLGGDNGGAYNVNDDREREHTLYPGAPVHIRRLQIRSPDQDFHDLMDYGPISEWPTGRDETATKANGSGNTGIPAKDPKLIHDKPSLAQVLSERIGGSYDKELFDALRPGHKADQVFNELVGKYKDDPATVKKIQKIYRDFFVGRPELPTKPHQRKASIQQMDLPLMEAMIERMAYAAPPPAIHVAALEDVIGILELMS